jgi:hypothetical protein
MVEPVVSCGEGLLGFGTRGDGNRNQRKDNCELEERVRSILTLSERVGGLVDELAVTLVRRLGLWQWFVIR